MVWRTTESADADIVAIEVHGTTTYSRARAQIYLDDLFSVFDLLARNPHMARERTEVNSRPRLYRFRAHHVLYIVEGDDIVILRILGGQQDWEHLL